MQLNLTLTITTHDDQLTLTTADGRTIIFTPEQPVQQQVCLVLFGLLSDAPKTAIAQACGYATKKSFYDHRDAVLHQPSSALLPQKRGPKGAFKRTPALDAFIVQRRAEKQEELYTLHQAVRDAGYSVGVRLVSMVLAEHGLTKKKRCQRPSPSPRS